MSLSPQEELERIERLRRELSENRDAVARVARLEEGTMFIPKEEVRQGYQPDKATMGYRIMVESFQATDQQLTATQDARLSRVVSVIDGLNSDAERYLMPWSIDPSARTQASLAAFTQEKMAQLSSVGETFIGSGHDRHFNVVRIKRYSDGTLTYTLYDSGHETRGVGVRIDEHGERRTQVNAVEERIIRPGASIEALIQAEATKSIVNAIPENGDTRAYQEQRAIIASLTEPTPVRVEVQDAQRRGNCTTRGQRIMMQDILADDTLAARVHGFITESTPRAVYESLAQEHQNVRAGRVRVPAPELHASESWKPYHSSSLGNSLRFETGYDASVHEVTSQMRSFADYMNTRGVEVQWGWRDGKAFAYVPQTDQASFNYLQQHIRAAERAVQVQAERTVLVPEPTRLVLGNQSFEQLLAERINTPGAIEYLGTNKGPSPIFRGDANTLNFLEQEFSRRGVSFVRETGTNSFGEGLRIRSQSVDTINQLLRDAPLQAAQQRFESTLSQKASDGTIERLGSSRGQAIVIRGEAAELRYLSEEFSRRGVDVVMENGDNGFGRGLRVRSASTALAEQILAGRNRGMGGGESDALRMQPMQQQQQQSSLGDSPEALAEREAIRARQMDIQTRAQAFIQAGVPFEEALVRAQNGEVPTMVDSPSAEMNPTRLDPVNRMQPMEIQQQVGVRIAVDPELAERQMQDQLRQLEANRATVDAASLGHPIALGDGSAQPMQQMMQQQQQSRLGGMEGFDSAAAEATRAEQLRIQQEMLAAARADAVPVPAQIDTVNPFDAPRGSLLSASQQRIHGAIGRDSSGLVFREMERREGMSPVEQAAPAHPTVQVNDGMGHVAPIVAVTAAALASDGARPVHEPHRVSGANRAVGGAGLAMSTQLIQAIQEKLERGETVSNAEYLAAGVNVGYSVLDTAGITAIDDAAGAQLGRLMPRLRVAGGPLVQGLLAVPMIYSASETGDMNAIGAASFGAIGGIGAGMAGQAFIPIPGVGFVIGVVVGEGAAKVGGLATQAMFDDDPAKRAEALTELHQIRRDYIPNPLDPLRAPGATINLAGAAISSVGRAVDTIGQVASWGGEQLNGVATSAQQSMSQRLGQYIPQGAANVLSHAVVAPLRLNALTIQGAGTVVSAVGSAVDSVGQGVEYVGHAANDVADETTRVIGAVAAGTTRVVSNVADETVRVAGRAGREFTRTFAREIERDPTPHGVARATVVATVDVAERAGNYAIRRGAEALETGRELASAAGSWISSRTPTWLGGSAGRDNDRDDDETPARRAPARRAPTPPPAPARRGYTIAANVGDQLEAHGFKPSMDRNRDGQIDINEIRATFRQHGLTAGQVDRNGDHIFSAREVSNAINAAVRRGRG